VMLGLVAVVVVFWRAMFARASMMAELLGACAACGLLSKVANTFAGGDPSGVVDSVPQDRAVRYEVLPGKGNKYVVATLAML
jgi:hypothetical protein